MHSSIDFFVSPLVPPKANPDDSLSKHPARRNVINFMRTMIVDSLSLQPTQKSSPVLDLLLDAQPENTTHAQQCR